MNGLTNRNIFGWKRAAALLLAAVLCLSVFTGCGGSGEAEKEASIDTSVEHTEDEKLILDCAGRTVAIPKEPERVAALDSFSGEVLVMIGAGEKMVAAPNGVKNDVLLQEIYPELSDVSAPMSGGTVNAETLLNLDPDFVLIKSTFYETEEEVEKLDKMGMDYLVVDYENMEEQQFALEMIGNAVGGDARDKADSINDYYKKTVSLVKEKSEKIPAGKRTSVYHSINELVRTDGPDTLGYDWIEAVGAKNVVEGNDLQADGGDYYTSPEQLFVMDPDVIICNEAETVDYLTQDGKWNGLRAVDEGRVYNIPVGATRWGQRGSLETYFAMLWLGTVLYPDEYADVDLKTEVKTFYKDILGLEISDETYEKILSGRGLRNASSSSGK